MTKDILISSGRKINFTEPPVADKYEYMEHNEMKPEPQIDKNCSNTTNDNEKYHFH